MTLLPIPGVHYTTWRGWHRRPRDGGGARYCPCCARPLRLNGRRVWLVAVGAFALGVALSPWLGVRS